MWMKQEPEQQDKEAEDTNMRHTLLQGDCLDRMKEMPDNSVNSVVTDPPYGLSFMGKKWDYDVPSVEVWKECLRVLKPGGHLLAFAGTRTQHRMAVRIEDAGFEIRDMIAWVYGCLSEDTEILIDGRWEPYHKAIDKGRALCYIPDHDRYEWQPIQDFIEYDYDDTAFRIVSDRTDQIVSRNHRCLVERGGKYVFRYAETLERQETIPVLEGLPELLRDLPLPHEGAGEQKSVLRQGVCAEESLQGQIAIGAQGTNGDVLDLRQRNMEAGCVAKENQSDVLLAQMQWGSEGEGVGESCLQGPGCVDSGERVGISGEDERREESSMEGGSDLLQAQGQICEPEDQVCEMPAGVCEHGTQGWVCDGAPLERSEGNRASVDADGVRASCEPRCDGQPTGKPDAICDELRPQEIRASRHTRPDLARVEPIHYKGKVWCVRVPSGAFVARRNGKVFVTGNSGFPKSLDVSKAIDRAAGAEREDLGPNPNQSGRTLDKRGGNLMTPIKVADCGEHSRITAPATDAARQWQGWGTALKPSWESVTVATKPLDVLGNCAKIIANLNERIESCRQIANNAEKSSRHSQADLQEVRINTAPESAATRTEDALENKMETGLVDATSSRVDTLESTREEEPTALNTLLSWRNTLEGVFNVMRTSTTATVFETITDWKILSYCLSQITLDTITKAKWSPNGLNADALRAVEYLNASLASLQSTLALSALAPAMSQEAENYLEGGVKPNLEPCIMARKPLSGTVAANVLEHGTGGLNVDGCRVGTEIITQRLATVVGGKSIGAKAVGVPQKATGETTQTTGRWPANLIHDGSEQVVGLFPVTTSGNLKGNEYANSPIRQFNAYGKQYPHESSPWQGDTGSAARFFYCAKASKADRDEGCEGLPLRQPVDGADKWTEQDRRRGEGVTRNPSRNNHPTVKPTPLMRYLCRLVTPPGGIVLDPFMGSGSTGKAAILEGFQFIGIERDAEYYKIAEARIKAVEPQLI